MVDTTDILINNAEGLTGIKLSGQQKDRLRKTAKAVAGGVPVPKYDNEKKQQLEELYSRLREVQLAYIEEVPRLGLDTLQIHDLVFAMPRDLTPPTTIRIDKDMINYKWHTLRTSDVQKVTSGHSTARIYLSLYFVGLQAINKGLRRLLAVFNSVPFVYVENSFIRANLTSKDEEKRNMACSLLSIAVRTEPAIPNVLVADLTLLWFNYKPFATDFWFRRDWNSVTDTPVTSMPVYDKKIVDLAGGPSIPSDQDIALAEPLKKNDPNIGFTPPAIFPQNSKPLQARVDVHLGLTMNTLDNRIEIGYREYRSVGGMQGQIIDAGKINPNLLREVSARNVTTNRNTLLRLHPDAALKFEEIARDFIKQFPNSKLRVTSCFRTREMQRQLQKTKPNVASRGYSWHEVGLAIDIGTAGMTRGQYKWLIERASGSGFKNLGTRNEYSPHFSDGGRWNDGGDPNATVKAPPASTIDSKGRLKNWETWHFDFVPVQNRARSKHGGGRTQKAIETLRGMIYYTSVEVGADEIVSETGEETSLEQVRQRDQETEEEIGRRLDGYLRDNWHVDPLGSDPVRILLYKDYKFIIEDTDTQLVPQGMTFAKSNIIAEIPILSHEFSTQQYMGSTDLDASISFIAVGEAKLRQLQTVISKIQNNARIAKGVRDAAVVDISNTVLNFGGMEQAMVESINATSIPDSPGLYQVMLTLTQAKRKQPEQLGREMYMELDTWKESARYVVDHLFNLDERIVKDIRYIADWEKLDEMTGESIDNDLDMRQELGVITQEDYDRLEPGTPGVDKRQWLWLTLQLLTPQARKWVYDENRSVRVDETNSSRYPGHKIKYLKESDLYETEIAKILVEYASIISMILGETFPKDQLYELGLEGLKDFVTDSYEKGLPKNTQDIVDEQIQTTINRAVKKPIENGDWGEVADIAEKIRESTPRDTETMGRFLVRHYKNRLQWQWIKIYNEAHYLHPAFGGLYLEMFETFEQYRRGTECYPDLKLPPNALTKHSLDTPPDYWFWNTSVDGHMFFDIENKEEVVLQFLANSYQGMSQMASEDEWENNYISPNKTRTKKKLEVPQPGIFKNDSWKKAIKRRFAGTPADEGGIGSLGEYKITGEMIGQTFDELAGHSPPKLDGKVVKMGGNNENAQIKPDREVEAEPVSDGYSGRIVDMVKKSMVNFDSEVYRLARAYPTFKVYFMEEDLSDSGRLGIRNFDDFYSYSAIKDIRIVRSRKIPADLCVISITNIHGELDTLAYGGNDEGSSTRAVEKFDPFKVNTNFENPFTRLVVLEGSKIQVRLGYSNSPDQLETVFTGQVVEVGVSPISPDIMQLVCQSYGTELVAKIKTGGTWNSTGELLSSMMCSEECFHFGRYERTAIFDPAEVRVGYQGESRMGFLALNQFVDSIKEGLLRSKNFRNKPQDDNIFAPEFGEYEAWGESLMDGFSIVGLSQIGELLNIVDDDRDYSPWRTTIWDVFKEMELRHPGYIALPVPYGQRYTMFFGHPSHKYWSRPLSEIERGGWGFVDRFIGNLRDNLHTQHMALFFQHQAISSSPTTPQVARAVHRAAQKYSGNMKVLDLHGKENSTSRAWVQFAEYLEWLNKGRAERYKPFREYHFLTSENNIIANNLRASAHGTFNCIELTYMADVVTHDDVQTEQEAQAEILEALQDDGEILRLKADDNIEEHNTRVMQAMYTTCTEDYFARRYCLGLLLRSLRDVYKGTIVITGNPKIKPYDVCVLFDTYRDIYGPVEVEQVTHTMSQETGFITEIKPDLVLTSNDLTTQCTMDAMVYHIAGLYDRLSDHIGPVPSAGTLVGGGAAVAGGTYALAGGVGLGILAAGGYKLVEWTQERQPILITPVMNGIKPLIAGIDGYKRDSLYHSLKGRWAKFAGSIDEGWNDWWERNPFSSWYHEKIGDWLN